MMNFSSDNLPHRWRLQGFEEKHCPQDSTQRRRGSRGTCKGSSFPGEPLAVRAAHADLRGCLRQVSLGTSPGRAASSAQTLEHICPLPRRQTRH